MRAVIYIRVSTDEQVSGTSLDSQEKACREYAQRQGFVVTRDDVFREEGVSAKIIDRPELVRMIKHCAENKGAITHCIVWKVDRLARKSEYHHFIKAQLAKNGVRLVPATEPIGDDPIGNLMDGVLAAFAQFDNDIRTVRTTGGMKARTLQGGWPHSAPYGYKSTRTPTGVITVTPNEDAPKLAEFLHEFSTGAYTVKQAADLAAEIGIRGRTGKKLHWQSVKNLITNPLYAGFVRTKFTDEELIPGLHKALIKEQIYYKNQAIISGNLKNWSREAVEEWPLRSGFLRHTCGKAMTGSSPRGRNGPSPRYSCPQCKARTLGKQTSKQRNLVHNEFLELLNTTRPNQGAQKLFKEIVLRQWNEEFKHGL
jgi:site-specific DNA recombinase